MQRETTLHVVDGNKPVYVQVDGPNGHIVVGKLQQKPHYIIKGRPSHNLSDIRAKVLQEINKNETDPHVKRHMIELFDHSTRMQNRNFLDNANDMLLSILENYYTD